MCTVAVITVSYNAEDKIKKTIKSVLNQNFEKIEYWIQDGGSTDETIEIIKGYEKKFINKNIKYGYEIAKDNGIYDAMNKAIDHLKSDFVIFLNAGDYFADEYVVKNIFSNLDCLNIDIMYGNYYRYYLNYRKKILPYNLSSMNKSFITSHQAIFTRTKLLKSRKYDTSYKMCADYDFYLDMYIQGKKFKYVDVCISYFEIDGISQVSSKISQEEVFCIRKKFGCISEREYKRHKKNILKICLIKWILRVIPKKIRLLKYEKF